MSENTNESRLPPPAFPPGARKQVHRNSRGADPAPPVEAPEDAYISPDEPMPARSRAPTPEAGAMGGAFISPDEPIPERRIELAEAFQTETIEQGEEGQVVGMDLNPHLEPEEISSGGDPHVLEVMQAVGKLSESLKRRGEAGLRSAPQMTRFEATLRSYCVGYLAGRRAEDPAPPELEEPLPSDG